MHNTDTMTHFISSRQSFHQELQLIPMNTTNKDTHFTLLGGRSKAQQASKKERNKSPKSEHIMIMLFRHGGAPLRIDTILHIDDHIVEGNSHIAEPTTTQGEYFHRVPLDLAFSDSWSTEMITKCSDVLRSAKEYPIWVETVSPRESSMPRACGTKTSTKFVRYKNNLVAQFVGIVAQLILIALNKVSSSSHTTC